MPTFEYVATVRCLVDAKREDRAEEIVREELEGACIEIEALKLVN